MYSFGDLAEWFDFLLPSENVLQLRKTHTNSGMTAFVAATIGGSIVGHSSREPDAVRSPTWPADAQHRKGGTALEIFEVLECAMSTAGKSRV